MNRLERIFYFLFPLVRLRQSAYWLTWEQEELKALRITARAALLIGALVEVAHFFLVDKPLALQPIESWAAYRFGVALVCAVVFLTTFRPGATRFSLRASVFGTAAFVCHFQSTSMLWYPDVPYLYGFLLACVAVLVMRDSQLKSSLYLLGLYAVQLPAWTESNIEPRHLTSAAVSVFFMVILFRSRMPADINGFISEQDKLAAQKRIIESEIELNQEIRAFLPREIYNRMMKRAVGMGTPVLQAVAEVLAPQQKQVACLFSDIRGFTIRTKDVPGYLIHGAVPNIRSCTELVEGHFGIPRLVGDLVFAYFDGEQALDNLRHAIQCAIELVELNQRLNAELPPDERVRRHVLLSFGEAVVGNIGGQTSAREITALGTPVNVLSRIDAITKDVRLAQRLMANEIILTTAAAQRAREVFPSLQLTELVLSELELSLRDFPEETSLWLLAVTDSIKPLVKQSMVSRVAA